jgi:hypothetical protein
MAEPRSPGYRARISGVEISASPLANPFAGERHVLRNNSAVPGSIEGYSAAH